MFSWIKTVRSKRSCCCCYCCFTALAGGRAGLRASSLVDPVFPEVAGSRRYPNISGDSFGLFRAPPFSNATVTENRVWCHRYEVTSIVENSSLKSVNRFFLISSDYEKLLLYSVRVFFDEDGDWYENLSEKSLDEVIPLVSHGIV